MAKSKRTFMLAVLAPVTLIACSAPALSQGLIEAIPNGWRIQRYVGGAISVFYTGSSCPQGGMNLAASSDEMNQFWSLLLTARSTQTKVGIYYDNSNNSCNIQSFYLKE